MAAISTDVLIIGTGPAGSAMAALLSSYGIENLVVNRYRWLAQTPRAHITNQRTMEVLRDLGPEVEAEAYLHATEQDLMGENVFCESLAGEEIGRMKSWGKHPNSRAEHQLSSPCHMNDLPQTFMEPILYSTACKRGSQGRMSTEYLRHTQDDDGVTTVLRDRLSGAEFEVHSKYLIGADGGNSAVCENEGLPIEGKMGVGGSMNILFMIRPWNEWLIVWGYDINEPAPEVDEAFATEVARQLVGDPTLEIDLLSASVWTVNDAYATNMQNGRVFIMGDAAHRHPPSNGLGSNTSIQDAYNLAWKVAAVLKGQAGAKLLDSYTVERAPIAKQIVTRANQSIGEFGPIFEALGMTGGDDHAVIKANMDARCDTGDAAQAQRKALRQAIAFKKYEFDAHGVEMNQRYDSDAVVTDGQAQPDFAQDPELHYQPTTWPGARLPHVWVFDPVDGSQLSTLDLCGKGGFTLLTGIGGEAWKDAASAVATELGIDLKTHVIGPRRDFVDHTGDWARACEISDSGCILVRPDQHVCWRSEQGVQDPQAELTRVFAKILGL